MLRGLETVVAAVLLIVVAVLGVVLVYWLFSGYVGRFPGVEGQAVAAEMFKVESAFLAADGSVKLLIRNIGGAPVNVSTIYVYPVGSLNPLCVKHGINTVISPGTLAAVETTLTCTPSPAPGGSYIIKVVTARGTEYAYIVTTTSTLAAGGGGGGGVDCSFVSSSGKWFGSPDGTPAAGFNELNGWVAAWGPSGGGVRVALMPGITPPDSTNTGASYTVELNNVQIGTLTVSGGTASVSITEPMPDFMEVVKIWVGGYLVYDGGPLSATMPPGAYPVTASLRVRPDKDVFGNSATLQLSCNGNPVAVITVRVPHPEEWGLKAQVYRHPGSSPPPPPGGSQYVYMGAWSVGAIYFWLNAPGAQSDVFSIRGPYFTSAAGNNKAPKWAAYWLSGGSWPNYAVSFTGRLFIPPHWGGLRIGAWYDNSVYVRIPSCSVDTGWSPAATTPRFYSWSISSCVGDVSVELWYYQRTGSSVFVFVVGPPGGNDAYIPTIDGAYRCDNFNWGSGTCGGSWGFVSANSAVPYFVAGGYIPGLSDGGGEPQP
jgi:hypothetical protein